MSVNTANKLVGAPVCPLCSPRPLRLSSTDGSNYLPRCHRPRSSSSPRLVWHFAAFYLLFGNIYRYIFLFSWSFHGVLWYCCRPLCSVSWENVVSGCERLLLEAGLWGCKEELYVCLFTVTARQSLGTLSLWFSRTVANTSWRASHPPSSWTWCAHQEYFEWNQERHVREIQEYSPGREGEMHLGITATVTWGLALLRP